VPKFTMCEHDFNNVVASFLSADSSSLDWFWLTFIPELFIVVLADIDR
jgi:hypothetical protein